MVKVQVRIAGAIKVELHLRFERHAHVILVAASPLRLIGDFESIDRLPNKAAALTRNRSVGVAVSGKREASGIVAAPTAQGGSWTSRCDCMD